LAITVYIYYAYFLVTRQHFGAIKLRAISPMIAIIEDTNPIAKKQKIPLLLSKSRSFAVYLDSKSVGISDSLLSKN